MSHRVWRAGYQALAGCPVLCQAGCLLSGPQAQLSVAPSHLAQEKSFPNLPLASFSPGRYPLTSPFSVLPCLSVCFLGEIPSILLSLCDSPAPPPSAYDPFSFTGQSNAQVPDLAAGTVFLQCLGQLPFLHIPGRPPAISAHPGLPLKEQPLHPDIYSFSDFQEKGKLRMSY